MPKGPRTAEVARRLVDAYVTSLRQHLPTYCIRQLDKLPGAQEHQLTRLRQSYPGAPTELLYFLQRVNGTCWESLRPPHNAAAVGAAAGAAAGASASATVTVTAAKDSSAASTTATAFTTMAPAQSPDEGPEPATATTATTTTTAKTTTTTTTTTTEAGAAGDQDAAASIGSGGEAAGAPPASSASPAPVDKPAGAPAPAAAAAAPSAATTSNPGAAAAAKSAAKATAAAAMASEAAAFIKSQIAKKVTTMTGPRQRRPLPHFVAVPILGSTYTGCPYYLKSVEQMLVAEQHFPPPSANLPDEGEGWAPPQGTPAPSAAATPAPAPASAATRDGSGDAAAEGSASTAPAASPPSAPGAALNTHSIASVYAGRKIIYGPPPPTPTLPQALSSSSSTVAAALAETNKSKPAAACGGGGGADDVVYVDPRIDIHASFYQWLVFADSVQPHVRGKAPTVPDADPAKMTAAAAAAAAASATGAEDDRFAPARAPSHTYTPPPPKQFAASRLYIDFKPVELHGGVCGQVIQYVHGKPDSFSVVAKDFGEYLKYNMTEEYEFTEELEDDDDAEDDDDDAKKEAKKPIPTVLTDAEGRPLASPEGVPPRAPPQG